MSNQHRYAIQCDKLQRLDQGELIWATLMNKAERIALDEFEDACDLSGLLEEGETLEDFIGSDEYSGAYRVRLGSQTTYFIQTSGFEFFFTESGEIPSCVEPTLKDWFEYRSSALARLLLPANHPLIQGAWGFESDEGVNEHGLKVISSDAGTIRYQVMEGDRAVGGARIEHGEITDIYTAHDRLRQGVASKLLDAIKLSQGPVRFGAGLSDDGKAFKAAYQKAKRQEVDEGYEF